MFRLLLLVSRQWQRSRLPEVVRYGSSDVRGEYRYRQEPIAGRLNDTSDYPDIATLKPSGSRGLRQQRSLLSGQKVVFSEIYKTRSKLREEFQRTMRTCELAMVVTQIVQ